MIKILHVSNTNIDFDSRIRKELLALGCLSGVQLSVVGVPDIREIRKGKIDNACYIRLYLISRSMKKFPRAIRYFFELIEFTVNVVIVGWRLKPQIVHCHDTFAVPSGWILKKTIKSKLVYDAHELESNKNGQNAILSKATYLIEKFCWKKIDLFISVSESIIDWYMSHLGYKNNVLVLNSPIISENSNKEYFLSSSKYFHVKYSLPSEHLVFVCIGILGPGRGIEICLEAFSSGPKNTHVVFIGYGNLEGKIIDFSKRFKNIHFHSQVPHDRVVEIISSADFGLCMIENVSLSDYFCLPNKLFEYCFARLPILASNFPEIRRVVEKYSLGICCEPNINNVRDALNSLVFSRQVRSGYDISELSWQTQADRLMDSYRQNLIV